MIYCILGMIILICNSEEQTEVQSTTVGMPGNMNTIYCDVLSLSKVYCGLSNKFASTLPTIPVDRFPTQMKTLDAHFMSTGGWQVKDERMFQNFAKLTELRLTGPVQFSSLFKEGIMKTVLMNELFNLPTLRLLNLLYWDSRDFDSWRLPRSLESLEMQKCGLVELDLSSNPNLVALYLGSNSLKKIPLLSEPPPPLEVMVLSNNPNIQFVVDEIANLCHLKQLAITQFNSLLDANRRYCECVRLKNYMKEFRIAEYEPINCEDSNKTNCSNYTLEFVRSRHENKCSNFTPATRVPPSGAMSTPFTTSWIQEHLLTLGIGSLLLISLLANLVFFGFVIRSDEQPEWDLSASAIEEEGAET